MSRSLIKQITLFTLSVVTLYMVGCAEHTPKESQPSLMGTLTSQMDTLQHHIDPYWNSLTFSPRSFTGDSLKMVDKYDWCSGFYPGTLWNMYALTEDPKWKERAIPYTEKLDSIKYLTGTHDLGFIIECSYGTALKHGDNASYDSVIVQTAKTLSKRFNPTVGALKSWDWSDEWTYPVIIDNMINLEILFHATRITKDSSYYKIAVAHANTTLQNHFRPDHSSFHVVDYHPTTGAVIQKNTHQGYADSSAWARGQAWGLYGYTMCYKETKDSTYLQQAQQIAAYISNHPKLPKDKIPYWDYDAPITPKTPRDASAAAVTASALYDLATFSKDSLSHSYITFADQIMGSLSAPAYLATNGENGGFLLKHATGDLPSDSEIDCGINYGDYYFVEALLRKKALEEQLESASITD